jgi:hypothetical protein
LFARVEVHAFIYRLHTAIQNSLGQKWPDDS